MCRHTKLYPLDVSSLFILSIIKLSDCPNLGDDEEDILSQSNTTGDGDVPDEESGDEPPSNVPEQVDVGEDTEQDQNTNGQDEDDILAGVDVFKDIVEDPCIAEADDKVEEEEGQSIVDQSYVLDDALEANAKLEPHKQPTPTSDSDSSVDLVDLELNFTRQEIRALRKKRKEQRKEAKRNQLLLRKRREEELAKAKKDRFFDKSRIIPNEIYFGDIVVPFHVLHSYGKTTNKTEVTQQGQSTRGGFSCFTSSAGTPLIPRSRFDPRTSPRIDKMKKYLRAAGISQKDYKTHLNRCTSETNAVAIIMRLLREHGLEGDPTLAKCRALRRMVESSDDSDELDTSVIINTKVRTLRSGTTIAHDEVSDEVGEADRSTVPEPTEARAE